MLNQTGITIIGVLFVLCFVLYVIETNGYKPYQSSSSYPGICKKRLRINKLCDEYEIMQGLVDDHKYNYPSTNEEESYEIIEGFNTADTDIDILEKNTQYNETEQIKDNLDKLEKEFQILEFEKEELEKEYEQFKKELLEQEQQQQHYEKLEKEKEKKIIYITHDKYDLYDSIHNMNINEYEEELNPSSYDDDNIEIDEMHEFIDNKNKNKKSSSFSLYFKLFITIFLLTFLYIIYIKKNKHNKRLLPVFYNKLEKVL